MRVPRVCRAALIPYCSSLMSEKREHKESEGGGHEDLVCALRGCRSGRK